MNKNAYNGIRNVLGRCLSKHKKDHDNQKIIFDYKILKKDLSNIVEKIAAAHKWGDIENVDGIPKKESVLKYNETELNQLVVDLSNKYLAPLKDAI